MAAGTAVDDAVERLQAHRCGPILPYNLNHVWHIIVYLEVDGVPTTELLYLVRDTLRPYVGENLQVFVPDP